MMTSCNTLYLYLTNSASVSKNRYACPSVRPSICIIRCTWHVFGTFLLICLQEWVDMFFLNHIHNNGNILYCHPSCFPISRWYVCVIYRLYMYIYVVTSFLLIWAVYGQFVLVLIYAISSSSEVLQNTAFTEPCYPWLFFLYCLSMVSFYDTKWFNV